MKIVYFSIAIVTIVIDQITKWIASTNLAMHDPVPVMPSFNFTLMHNYGAAFSFLSDAGGWQRWFFTIVAAVISVVLVVWIIRLKAYEKWLGIGLSLVLGGAIGNLIDRLIYQYVVDFIHVFYGDYHFPHFNIADSAIFIGAVLLIAEAFNWPFLDTKLDTDTGPQTQ